MLSLTLAGLLAFFAAPSIARFFIPEGGAVIEQSAIFIRAIALTFGFIGLQQVLTGSLRGAGDTVAPMVLAMISLWVLRFPLAYVLSAHTYLHVRGIWYAFPVTTVISAAMAGGWYRWGGWRNRRLLDESRIPGTGPRSAEFEEGARSERSASGSWGIPRLRGYTFHAPCFWDALSLTRESGLGEGIPITANYRCNPGQDTIAPGAPTARSAGLTSRST